METIVICIHKSIYSTIAICIHATGFQNIGDVSGMKMLEELLQRVQVLPMDQRLDQVMARALLAMHEVLHQFMPVQQLNDLRKLVLRTYAAVFSVIHGYGAGEHGLMLQIAPLVIL